MNDTQIRCFLAVARRRSFSRAAEELYLTQPSVSRYIGQLEEEWGTALFVRSGKSVALTPQGEDYYRLCLRFETELAELKRRHSAPVEQAVLSLQYAVFPVWSISRLLYENMERMRERHPGWSLSMQICQAENLVSELRQGSVDLIFAQGGVLRDYPELETRPLLELPQIILYSSQSPLAQKPDLSPADFAGEDFLFVPDQIFHTEMIRRQTRSMEKRYGFTPRTRLLTNGDELTLALELGQGVALMDDWSRYKSNPLLRWLTIDLPLPVVLAWRRDNPNPAIPVFAGETAEFFQSRTI